MGYFQNYWDNGLPTNPTTNLPFLWNDLSTRTTSWSTMCRHTARNRQPVGYVGLRFLGPFTGFNGIYSQLTLFWIILGVSEMRCTPKRIWVKRCKFRWAGSTPDGHYGRVIVPVSQLVIWFLICTVIRVLFFCLWHFEEIAMTRDLRWSNHLTTSMFNLQFVSRRKHRLLCHRIIRRHLWDAWQNRSNSLVFESRRMVALKIDVLINHIVILTNKLPIIIKKS